MDNVTAAKELIGLLDLTSLNKDDTETSISKLCQKAQTPYGNTAAVCIYPKFISLAKQKLQGTDIKIATVVNFPQGGNKCDILAQEVWYALSQEADEIDAVLPYRDFLAGNMNVVNDFFTTLLTQITPKKTPLKIIIESGELAHAGKIANATKLCIEKGASFVKTSTGKSKISATPEAANIILETIRDSGKNVGFKASGGIREFEEARKYLILSEVILGEGWATPEHFRIGASSLLNNLLSKLNGEQ